MFVGLSFSFYFFFIAAFFKTEFGTDQITGINTSSEFVIIYLKQHLSFLLFLLCYVKEESFSSKIVWLGLCLKKENERKGGKNNTDPAVVHSEVHPSELKITYILFPLFLENCPGHRGGRVASCALKCLKPLQSVLHCLRLPK